jgi:hypothetical protein
LSSFTDDQILNTGWLAYVKTPIRGFDCFIVSDY